MKLERCMDLNAALVSVEEPSFCSSSSSDDRALLINLTVVSNTYEFTRERSDNSILTTLMPTLMTNLTKTDDNSYFDSNPQLLDTYIHTGWEKKNGPPLIQKS